jgi:hypothetical protein
MSEKHPVTDNEVIIEENGVEVEPVMAVLPANRPRKVYSGMWGPLEIGAVAVGALSIVFVGVLYFFWVLPSSRELARNKSEAERLEVEVMSANSKYGEITSTQDQVSRIVSSVESFESGYLPVISTGQSALYQRLNNLISAYDLVNTSGPDYAPLETVEQNATVETDSEKGRTRYRSLYPGVYVSTTLEGTYQNLRRFIRDIETGRDFIIVSAVELAPSDTETRGTEPNNGRPPQQQPQVPQQQTAIPNTGRPLMQPGPGFPAAGPQGPQSNPYAQAQAPAQSARPRVRGKTHGEVVSLHIEMAAYFRRPMMAPIAQ